MLSKFFFVSINIIEDKILFVFSVSVSEIDQYLWMVGGSAGALALTGVAAASAFYLSTRPKPEKPLVTLHEQSLLEPVRFTSLYNWPEDVDCWTFIYILSQYDFAGGYKPVRGNKKSQVF